MKKLLLIMVVLIGGCMVAAAQMTDPDPGPGENPYTGVEQQQQENTISEINTYFNSGVLNIECEAVVDNPLTVCLYDICGRKIYEQKILPQNKNVKMVIPAYTLSKGIYVVGLYSGKQQKTVKIGFN